MANYIPPEGFIYDPNSGLYYRQEMINDGVHQPYPVVNWFDPRTGHISQNPLPPQVGNNIPTQQQGQPLGYPGGNMQQQPWNGYSNNNTQQPPSKKGGRTALIVCLVILLCAATGVGSVLFYKYVIADDKNKTDGSGATANNSTTESMIISPVTELTIEQATVAPVTEASTEARTAVPATEEVTEKKTETPATEKATEKKTEAATEKKTTAPTSEAVAVDYGIGWIEGNYMGTDPNLEGAQPTISINGNGHMDMTLNFGEGFNSYKCTYETSGKKNEMDDLYVYVTVINPNNGIPSKCTLVFSDSPDYFCFMDEGFGLMGYSGAPYYFTRVD